MQLPNEAKPGTVPPVNTVTDGVCHHFGKSAAHFSKMLEWKQEILNVQRKSAANFEANTNPSISHITRMKINELELLL